MINQQQKFSTDFLFLSLNLLYTFLLKDVEETEFLFEFEIGLEVRAVVEYRLDARAMFVPLVFP